jgi:hypothetical protein
MAAKGVREMIRRINEGAAGGYGGLRKDGPARYTKVGPWRAELEGHTGRLFHYGTKMLEWTYQLHAGDSPMTITVTETWTGHGSVSDQTGVNGALDALGSRLHYYRDSRGGGPRINPSFRVGSMVGTLRSISPAQYNPQGLGMTFPPQYNPRRTRRRR